MVYDFFAIFCEVNGELDASSYRIDRVRQLLTLFADRDDEVVTSAWSALDALVKSMDKDKQDLENRSFYCEVVSNRHLLQVPKYLDSADQTVSTDRAHSVGGFA
ncbi:hypothetical protein QFC24_002152 [Naganishia onofrii]|uniref:Uncharacterized protein n=1 Tax=Naganishia onofrii TaxID=1851511 RepID=A0ACC2XQW6_9TREE|nr:hypothetical protein QFC24_002152 [Naganishia onofrii]